MPKLTKIAPEWHAQAASELARDFSEVAALSLSAARRRAYLGLKFIYVKERGKADGSIPHGQLDPWLQTNCPGLSRRTIGNYIAEAKSISERLGWQIGNFCQFETAPHRLLEATAEDLPPKMQKPQQMLMDLLDGKGKFRPVTHYKQVEDGADTGESRVKRGRAKGEGGASRQQRVAAAELSEETRLELLASKAEEVSEWLMLNADARGFGLLDQPHFDALGNSLETAWAMFRQLRQARA